MKSRVLLMFYTICGWARIFRIFYLINRDRTVNISYHNILPDQIFDNSIHLGVSHPASVFEKQLIHISKRFAIRVDDPDQRGGCRITFDDGYLNQREIAARILEKYGIRGVFFVPVEPLESGRTLAVDQIMEWFSYVPPGKYSVGELQIDLCAETRIPAFAKVMHHLLGNADQWYTMIEQLEQAFPYSRLNVDPEIKRLRFTPLSRQDLNEMRANGHRIGCHGWDHRPLATLAPQMVSDELALCREKSRLYCNCDEFSYPFGGEVEVNRAVAIACRESGFSHGFMNVDVVSEEFADVRQHAIPRTSLPVTCSVHVLDAKLSGFEGWIKQILRRSRLS